MLVVAHHGLESAVVPGDRTRIRKSQERIVDPELVGGLGGGSAGRLGGQGPVSTVRAAPLRKIFT